MTAPVPAVAIGAQQDRAGHVTVAVRVVQARGELEERTVVLALRPLEAQALGWALDRVVSSLGVRR